MREIWENLPVWNDRRHVFCNIADGALIARLFAEHQPRAVQPAAESLLSTGRSTHPGVVQTNVVGTFRLLEAARTYRQPFLASMRDRFH